MNLCRVLVAHSLRNTNVRQLLNRECLRKSHTASYREAPPPHSKKTRYGAEIVGATMWWWVLWHLWHEYEHITGEFEYPTPSLWTNTQLGIPSEDQ